jgi:putative membrane protein
MRWWCVAVNESWSWVPRPYLGVWVLCIGLLVSHAVATRRHQRRHPESLDGREGRRAVWFALGVGMLWLASDWPVGALGAGYLSSIHMLQYMLYTLGAAPLMMLGTPEWMARAIVERTHSAAAVRLLTRPLVAAILFNLVLLATHAPVSVDTLRSTQVGNFVLDMIWLFSGLLLWAPVIGPITEWRARSAPARIVYLFCAAALIPMIPGGFIAFASQPLYGTYELAPRVGVSALDDQQMAGVLMKIGNIPIIWAVMGVIWFRWYESEQRSARRRQPVRGARSAAASRTADVTVVSRETVAASGSGRIEPPTPTGADLN